MTAAGTPLTNVVSIGAGHDRVCAVRTDSTVWCWGYNGYGQIGDGADHDPACCDARHDHRDRGA